MTDLKNMTAKEALRAAKETSGLTIKEIAAGIGVSAGNVKRYLKEDDPYWPSLEKFPRLYIVLGNTLLLDWLTAQIEEKSEDKREAMLSSVKNAGDVLEDMRLLIEKTENLTCWEAEGISAALDEVAFECERIRVSLPQRNGYGCRKEQGLWCPLWKFWKRHFSKTPGGQERR